MARTKQSSPSSLPNSPQSLDLPPTRSFRRTSNASNADPHSPTPAEFRVHASDLEAHSDPEATSSMTADSESVRARARRARARVNVAARAREREENATWRRRRAEEEAREEFKFSGSGQPARVVKTQTQTTGTTFMIKTLTTKGKGTANRHAQASTSVIAPVRVPGRETKPLPARSRTRKPKDSEPTRKGSRVSQRLVDKKTVTATKKCREEEEENVDPLARA
ncbi:hypothetical protein C8F01DRAFT_474116 [Mycena amicta]|nr:hypothetical protein C8F01DRAFT_474116 [Mycena amicta]